VPLSCGLRLYFVGVRDIPSWLSVPLANLVNVAFEEVILFEIVGTSRDRFERSLHLDLLAWHKLPLEQFVQVLWLMAGIVAHDVQDYGLVVSIVTEGTLVFPFLDGRVHLNARPRQ
jgi:hypothetical protein